jgi:hypothetical protein
VSSLLLANGGGYGAISRGTGPPVLLTVWPCHLVLKVSARCYEQLPQGLRRVQTDLLPVCCAGLAMMSRQMKTGDAGVVQGKSWDAVLWC